MKKIKANIVFSEYRKEKIEIGYRPLFKIDNQFFSGVITFPEKKCISPDTPNIVFVEFILVVTEKEIGDIIFFFENPFKESMGSIEILQILE